MSDKRLGLHLAIDRDGWTGLLQLSICDAGGGYRLYGPKYNGSSEPVGTCRIDQRAADEIRRYLDRYFPPEPHEPGPER